MTSERMCVKDVSFFFSFIGISSPNSGDIKGDDTHFCSGVN